MLTKKYKYLLIII